MSVFIEVTEYPAIKKLLINTDCIERIQDLDGEHTIIYLSRVAHFETDYPNITVNEDYETIKHSLWAYDLLAGEV